MSNNVRPDYDAGMAEARGNEVRFPRMFRCNELATMPEIAVSKDVELQGQSTGVEFVSYVVTAPLVEVPH
ncbi:hypothetical protein MSAS_14070 [Mycobacterium saskatchewanense]|uniref:Uncharacterized protein n=1 Tax=Mycobacterium saskatchewanense TaxID=220927 RepID=A0AAJ3TU90_9MYCO|nr:hypothetical protein AWC23_25865 [Mycobacterium saskatchewanense]BBX62233.1 hypothetical protein MSAS_14070 [Mycobacterium saskatchewanense]